MSEHSAAPKDAALKGANMARKRNALGRGLSALMSAAAVSVDVAGNPRNTGDLASSASQTASPNLEVLDGRLESKIEVKTEPRAELKFESKPEPKNGASKPSSSTDAGLEGGLIYLSVDRVSPNKSQPRQHFVQKDIDTLSESIRTTGLLQPIVVRRRPGDAPGQLATYEIVAGERRWRAAKQAGLVKIPALLRQINDREALELGIVENVQRSDLNPIEEAAAYRRLSEDFGANQAEIAEKVGKDRASVANALRLLKLAPEVQQLIVRGELTAGHGRALLMNDAHEAQVRLAKQIISEGLSVRAAEQLSSGKLKTIQPGSTPKVPQRESAATLALEDRLRRALGTKVKLSLDPSGAGEMRINFYSNAELDRLLEKFGA